MPTVLSFNVWSGRYPLKGITGFDKSTVYDLLDYLTSNILLPVDGFFIALSAGWAVSRRLIVEELRLTPVGAAVLQFPLRYVVPARIAAAVFPDSAVATSGARADWSLHSARREPCAVRALGGAAK